MGQGRGGMLGGLSRKFGIDKMVLSRKNGGMSE